MAVGETIPLGIDAVPGLRLGVASAGIKREGRKDLVVFELAENNTLAAVFTRNAFAAAPVLVAKEHLRATENSRQAIRYLLVNTGNANAGTGAPGIAAAEKICRRLAELTGVSNHQVLPYSTGVIGESLPVEKILTALPDAISSLNDNGWRDAAEAILTTDTRPKGATRKVEVAGSRITISGIAKGAGMIRPDMATMLAYIACDACVEEKALQGILESAVAESFNRITIDGDTSTNDGVVLVATGAAGVGPSTAHDFDNLAQAVTEVCTELAQAIVRDGEGATKFVTVRVVEGASDDECLSAAYAVAESPLVKTALFASDPNWGRILAAVGRAGIPELDIAGVTLWLGDVLVAENGALAPHYREQAGLDAITPEEITLTIALGRGDCEQTVWTTDLSHDYIRINAEYRT